jgi:hypothetical protein
MLPSALDNWRLPLASNPIELAASRQEFLHPKKYTRAAREHAVN